MELVWLTALLESGGYGGSLRRFSGSRAVPKNATEIPAGRYFWKNQPALQAGGLEAATAAMCNLKSVVVDLGQTLLFDACSKTVPLSRQGKREEAVTSYEKPQYTYCEIVGIIHSKEEARQDG